MHGAIRLLKDGPNRLRSGDARALFRNIRSLIVLHFAASTLLYRA